jgi:glycerol-3-phosphate cytidylyltransferase
MMSKGFTASAFDLLHSGHIAMLEEAKSVCDYLVVGLQVNPQLDRPDKHKPIQSVTERYLQLKACKYVDEIIPYETEGDLYNLLQILHPDIRIVGEEYLDRKFTGKDLPIKIYYNRRQHSFSSSELRERIKNS